MLNIVTILPSSHHQSSKFVFKPSSTVHLSSLKLSLIQATVRPFEPAKSFLHIVGVGTNISSSVFPNELPFAVHQPLLPLSFVSSSTFSKDIALPYAFALP